jgi:hypothetical protein
MTASAMSDEGGRRFSRSAYDDAYRLYTKRVGIVAFVSFGLFLADLAVAGLLLRSLVGTADVPCQPVVESTVGQIAVMLGIFAGAGAIPVGVLIFAVKRARRNPALLCSDCGKSLAAWDWRSHVKVTGKCPYCRQQVMDGELRSRAEVLERFQEQTEQMRYHLRFAYTASFVGMVTVYATFVYLEQSGINQHVDWMKLVWWPPVIFLTLPTMMWWIGRQALKTLWRYIDAFPESPERESN